MRLLSQCCAAPEHAQLCTGCAPPRFPLCSPPCPDGTSCDTRCCHAHDCCYKRLSSVTCVPHLATYKFSIKRGQITCGKRWHEARPLTLSGNPFLGVLQTNWLQNHLLGRGWKARKGARSGANAPAGTVVKFRARRAPKGWRGPLL